MRRIIALILLTLHLSCSAAADNLSITFLNDYFAPDGRDRWLTNDARLTYNEWTLGSQMYTPTDKRNPEVPVGDRPWDGYSYLEYKYDDDINGSETRQYTIRVGAVGDDSKAKRLQKFVHNDLGFGSDPQGWDTANPSEFTLDLIYAHTNRGTLDTWIGHSRYEQEFGFRAGNVVTEAFVEQRVYGSLFEDVEAIIGLKGRGVLYNTFLDGRLFHGDIYTVECVPLVAEFRAGIKLFEYVQYTFVYQTEEFEGQSGRHVYGELILGVNW